MKKFKIRWPSEKSMQIVMNQWLGGEHIMAERVPFVFFTKERNHT